MSHVVILDWQSMLLVWINIGALEHCYAEIQNLLFISYIYVCVTFKLTFINRHLHWLYLFIGNTTIMFLSHPTLLKMRNVVVFIVLAATLMSWTQLGKSQMRMRCWQGDYIFLNYEAYHYRKVNLSMISGRNLLSGHNPTN